MLNQVHAPEKHRSPADKIMTLKQHYTSVAKIQTTDSTGC